MFPAQFEKLFPRVNGTRAYLSDYQVGKVPDLLNGRETPLRSYHAQKSAAARRVLGIDLSSRVNSERHLVSRGANASSATRRQGRGYQAPLSLSANASKMGGRPNVRGGVLTSEKYRKKILAQRERSLALQPIEAAEFPYPPGYTPEGVPAVPPAPQPPVLPTSAVAAEDIENAVELLETRVQEGNLYDGDIERLPRAILKSLRKDGINLDDAQLVDYLRRLENICSAVRDFLENAVLDAGSRGRLTVKLVAIRNVLKQFARDLTKAINLIPLIVELVRRNVSKSDANRILPKIASIPFSRSSCYTDILSAVNELSAYGEAIAPEATDNEDELAETDVRRMKYGELRKLARRLNVKGWYKAPKAQLLQLVLQKLQQRLPTAGEDTDDEDDGGAAGRNYEDIVRGEGMQRGSGIYRGGGTQYAAGDQTSKVAVANARASAQRRLAEQRAYQVSYNQNLPQRNFSQGLNRSRTQYNNYISRSTLQNRLSQFRALENEDEQLQVGEKLDDPYFANEGFEEED